MYEIIESENENPFKKYETHWGKIEQCEPENALQEAVKTGKVIVATDGSNKNDEGAQGWLVTNRDGKILVKGRGRVACAKEDASSLRPELAAILAAVSYLSWFVNDSKIKWSKTKKVTLYTDSKNSIQDLEQSLFPTTKNVFENNIDIKMETKKALRTSPLKFELVHVEAHQDEHVPFDELPLPAQLNCIVDEYVGGAYTDSAYNETYQFVPFLKSQICSLSLPFRRPTSHVREQLVSFANGHKAEKQLSTFWNMPPSWQCNIEWGGLRTAIRREVGILHKTRLSKLIHKQLPTMQMMKRNGFSLSDTCPLCKTAVEDWNHVLRCKCDSASIERMKKLSDIKKCWFLLGQNRFYNNEYWRCLNNGLVNMTSKYLQGMGTLRNSMQRFEINKYWELRTCLWV
jgi:ribonuclease HI